jgi:serine/threonine-protein kinase
MMLQRRYRLERLIGAGTSSEVWQGHDELLRRPVAIRLLRADRAELAESFLAEGRAAARLTHANVAAVYDVGTIELPDRGEVPYVVMEFVDGATVADRLRHGPLTPDEVAQVGAEVGAALAHAHGQWVTHGALTTAKVAITDVGAKVFGFTDRRGADPHDVGLDVHALGTLLRAALTTPAHAAVPAPATLDLVAPAGLAAVIARCLDPDPVLRPGSDEAALAFARIAGTRVDLPAWYTLSATAEDLAGPPGHSIARQSSARHSARQTASRLAAIRLSAGRPFSSRRPSVLPWAFPPMRLRRDSGAASVSPAAPPTTDDSPTRTSGPSTPASGPSADTAGSSTGVAGSPGGVSGSFAGAEGSFTGAPGSSMGAAGWSDGASGSSIGAGGSSAGAPGSSIGAEGSFTGAPGSPTGAAGWSDGAPGSSIGSGGWSAGASGSSIGAGGSSARAAGSSGGAAGGGGVLRPWIRPATELGARSAAHTRIVLAKLPFGAHTRGARSRSGAALNDVTLVDLRSSRTTPPPRAGAPEPTGGRRWAIRAVVGAVVAGIVSLAAVAALGQPQAEGRPPSSGTLQTATAAGSAVPAVTTTQAPAPPVVTAAPHTQPATRPPATRPHTTRPATSAPASASASASAESSASASPSASPSASVSPSASPSESATASPSASPTASPAGQ